LNNTEKKLLDIHIIDDVYDLPRDTNYMGRTGLAYVGRHTKTLWIFSNEDPEKGTYKLEHMHSYPFVDKSGENWTGITIPD